MAKRKTTPHFWTEVETNHFINVIKDINIMAFVDGRKYRDSEIRRAAAVVVLNFDTGRRSGNDGNCVMTFSMRRDVLRASLV